MRPESGSPYRVLAMRFSCAGSRLHARAMWGSSVVMIQSLSGGSGALRYADLISMVAMVYPWMMESWRMEENVRGMIVGLYVGGGVISTLSMARRSVSPLAAARALCLSGSPLARFLRLHFRVVRIFQTRLVRVLVGKLPVASLWMGIRVFVTLIRLSTSRRMAAMNLSLSGARRASLVSIIRRVVGGVEECIDGIGVECVRVGRSKIVVG